MKKCAFKYFAKIFLLCFLLPSLGLVGCKKKGGGGGDQGQGQSGQGQPGRGQGNPQGPGGGCGPGGCNPPSGSQAPAPIGNLPGPQGPADPTPPIPGNSGDPNSPNNPNNPQNPQPDQHEPAPLLDENGTENESVDAEARDTLLDQFPGRFPGTSIRLDETDTNRVIITFNDQSQSTCARSFPEARDAFNSLSTINELRSFCQLAVASNEDTTSENEHH